MTSVRKLARAAGTCSLLALAVTACGSDFTATGSAGLDAGASGGREGGPAPSSGGRGAGGRAGADAAPGGATASGGAAGASGAGGADAGPLPGAGGAAPEAGVDPAVDPPRTGLLLWLRADVGVTETSGRVSAWADQSGNRLDALQASASLRPKLVKVDGKPTLEFDGVDDYLRLPVGFADFSAGISLFAVVHSLSSDGCPAFLQLSNGSEIDDINLGQDQGKLLYEVLDAYPHGGDLNITEPQLFSVVHDTEENAVLRLNGQISVQEKMPLPEVIDRTQAFIGKSLYSGCGAFRGRLSELLIYERAVDAREVLRIERQLRDRWACCVSTG